RARIAVVGARRPARLRGVGGTRGARARAGLREVALARRRAADGARGLEGIGGTGVARPVAGLGLVADAGRGRARGAGRHLRIGRAVGPGARARLLRIALTRGRAAHHGRGLEAVGGTGRAGAGAALGGVAGPAEARQMVPALPAGCVHAGAPAVPLHTSEVQTL